MRSEEITYETFASRLDESFTVETDQGPLDVDLVEVEKFDLGVEVPGGRQPFTLIFRGPEDRILGQDMYRLVHAELGELELFVVPILSIGEGQTYQVTFA